MYQVIIVIHILLGLSIIGLILMQQGKGADAGAAFGTGSSGSVFGAQGAASFLSRTTAILATMFFITSLGLAWINGNKTATADFMGTPAVEKEVSDLGLPDVNGASIKENQPAPLPESKPGTALPKLPKAEQPVNSTPPTGANPPLEQTVVPKVEEVKVIEESESELKPEKPNKASAKKK